MRGKSRGEARLIAIATAGLLAALGNLSPGARQSGGATEEETVVERLQKSYDAVSDFVAEFSQETEIKTLSRSLKARGKVYFKRPGKMLWRYDEPPKQWVLADGNSLYLYQPEQSQILKSPLKSAFRSDIPLSFLLGLGDLKRDFRVVLKGAEEGRYVLRLAPKGETGALSEIELGVDRKAFDVVWARIRDAVGNVTTIRFSNMRKGAGLKDSLFQPKIPDGVDVVELGS